MIINRRDYENFEDLSETVQAIKKLAMSVEDKTPKDSEIAKTIDEIGVDTFLKEVTNDNR